MVNGEILRVAVEYTSPGASVANTVHFYQLVGGSVSDTLVATQVGNHFEDNWAVSWAELAASVSECVEAAFDIVNVDMTVVRNIGRRAINLAGSAVGEPPAAATSSLMTASTGIPTSVGKKYAPFLAHQALDDGLLTSAALVLLGDLFTDWVADITVDGSNELVSGIIRRVAEEFKELSGGGSESAVPSYQRRRKPNVGS